jgi:hypothetical protein
MLTEQEYLRSHPMKLLQGFGSDSLYQSLWGARTLSNIMEMEALQRKWNSRPAPKPRIEFKISDELARRNERCIAENGCGMWSPF